MIGGAFGIGVACQVALDMATKDKLSLKLKADTKSTRLTESSPIHLV